MIINSLCFNSFHDLIFQVNLVFIKDLWLSLLYILFIFYPQNGDFMLGSLQSNQRFPDQQALKDILNLNHELCQLSDAIDCKFIEDKLAIFYSSTGRPSHSIRLMASLLILKSVRNLSDEKLVNKQWRENIYYQYFSGYQYHSLEKPCTSSQLVHCSLS